MHPGLIGERRRISQQPGSFIHGERAQQQFLMETGPIDCAARSAVGDIRMCSPDRANAGSVECIRSVGLTRRRGLVRLRWPWIHSPLAGDPAVDRGCCGYQRNERRADAWEAVRTRSQGKVKP